MMSPSNVDADQLESHTSRAPSLKVYETSNRIDEHVTSEESSADDGVSEKVTVDEKSIFDPELINLDGVRASGCPKEAKRFTTRKSNKLFSSYS